MPPLEPSDSIVEEIQQAVLQERERSAQERSRLLNTVTQIASLLLRSHDYVTVLPDVVRLLGEAVGSDRCLIIQELPEAETGRPWLEVLAEWARDGISEVSAAIPDGEPQLVVEGEWAALHEQLRRGELTNYIVAEMPEPWRGFLAAQEVVSSASVPILVQGQFWGHIDFDNCHEARLYDAAEIGILQTAAEIIAGAIERQAKDEELLHLEQARTRSAAKLAQQLERLNSELQQRDRLLSVVAQVTKDLLEAEDVEASILSAFRVIGEVADMSRVMLIFERQDPVSRRPQHCIIQEWTAAGVDDHHAVGLAVLDNEDFQVLIQPMYRGESVWRVIDEFPPRTRSHFERLAIQSSGVVPIFLEGRYFGCVAFDDCLRPRQWSQQEIDVLAAAAESIGAALHRKQLVDRFVEERIRAEQERSQQLERLNAELQQTLDRLESRDRILEATATAANTLLTVENLDEAVNTALKIIGEGLDTDRVAVIEMESFDRSSNLSLVGWQVLYEWDSLNTVSQLLHSDLARGNHEGIEAWLEPWVRGESVSCLIEDLPEPFRSRQAAIGVKSLHIVPILINGKFWGTIGVDDCLEAKRRSPAELAVLKTAAACIGSAIQRDRTQKAILQAEQERSQELERLNAELRQTLDRLQARDLLLDATAEAASVVLSDTDFDRAIRAALETLGTSVDCDRVEVFQHFDTPEQSMGVLRLLYEWDSVYASSQMTHPTLTEIAQDGQEELWLRLRAGECLSDPVEDYPEPFRSGQIELGVQSTHSVPIFVDGQYWGIVAIDHCRERRQLTSVELSVFKTAAACVGSAIKRDRTQKAMLQAEQERSQELERLNAELQQTLDRLSESEERYRTLFEISSEGIYRFELEQPIPINLSVDEQVKLIYRYCQIAEVNATYAAMYERDDPEDLIGLRLTDVHVADSEQNRAFLQACVESGYQIHGIESEELDLDGNPRYFLNNISTIIKDGYAIGGWASQLDITELRLAQQALLQAEQDRVAELAKTNQALKNSLDRLAADPNLNAFLGHVVLEISEQLNLHTAWVELYDSSAQTLQAHIFVEQGIVRLKPDSSELGYLSHPYAAEDDMAWQTLLQMPVKQPLVVTLENANQFFTGDALEFQLQWGQQHEVQSGLNMLLMLDNQPLGLLVLLSHRLTYTPEELELAQALAQQATLAIQLARLAEEAKQAAIYEERNRLAGEIHDTLAQAFTGISIQLGIAKDLVASDPAETRRILDRALTLAQIGLTEARRSVWALYPPAAEYANLDRALEQMIDRLINSSNTTQVQFRPQGEPYPVPTLLGMNLLRIAQEGLTNALKHSQASLIAIDLCYERDRVTLQIQDNGCGFVLSEEQGGFGIVSLYARSARIGGELQLLSQPGEGTAIRIQVALDRFTNSFSSGIS